MEKAVNDAPKGMVRVPRKRIVMRNTPEPTGVWS